ncbi:MAG: hypothetical protein H5T71_08285, partial [Chloroflexi bacterium]|nr:hypothetical protein [Chloroflexota bacterium]
DCPPQQCGALAYSERGSNIDEEIYLPSPQGGTYYVWIKRYTGSGNYILGVEFIRTTPTPTLTRTPRPTGTPTATPAPWSGETESEPNGTLSAANPWTPTAQMRGQIASQGDLDFFRWQAPESGIYTLTLSDVPATIEADLVIFTAGGYIIASKYDAGPGEPVSLTIDANGGDTYIVRVRASSTNQVSPQYYRL